MRLGATYCGLSGVRKRVTFDQFPDFDQSNDLFTSRLVLDITLGGTNGFGPSARDITCPYRIKKSA